MAALSVDNLDIMAKRGELVSRGVAPTESIYGCTCVQLDASGNVVALNAASGKYEGIAPSGGMRVQGPGVHSGGGGRLLVMAQRGDLLVKGLTGVGAADMDRPVWCTTNNFNEDSSLSYSAGAKLIGAVHDLSYNDRDQVIENEAWVKFDTTDPEAFGCRQREQTCSMLRTIATTARVSFYRVPEGKAAALYLAYWWQRIKANYATSAILKLNRIRGGVRTSLATSVDVNNVATAVDTPTAFALTGAMALLLAGDVLELEVITSGGETTAGELYASVNLVEYAKVA